MGPAEPWIKGLQAIKGCERRVYVPEAALTGGDDQKHVTIFRVTPMELQGVGQDFGVVPRLLQVTKADDLGFDG
jgi:hypothetical protein